MRSRIAVSSAISFDVFRGSFRMRWMNRRVWLSASFSAAVLLHGQTAKAPGNVNWSEFEGNVDALAYSPLEQINKGNVKDLGQAWFFPVPGTSARFDFSPLIVDGQMYALGKGNEIICLDAVTGRQIWSHPTDGLPTDRGMNYWES